MLLPVGATQIFDSTTRFHRKYDEKYCWHWHGALKNRPVNRDSFDSNFCEQNGRQTLSLKHTKEIAADTILASP